MAQSSVALILTIPGERYSSMTLLVTSRCDGARGMSALTQNVHPRENEATYNNKLHTVSMLWSSLGKRHMATPLPSRNIQFDLRMHRRGLYGTVDAWREVKMLERMEEAENKMRAVCMLWRLGTKACGNAFWKQSD